VRGAQKPSFHEIGIKENQWVSVTSEIPARAKMADLLAFPRARARGAKTPGFVALGFGATGISLTALSGGTPQ
jgi:hypothetical protein